MPEGGFNQKGFIMTPAIENYYGSMFGISTAGDVYLSGEYQMTDAVDRSINHREPSAWEVDFYSFFKNNIPAPCVYKGHRCFQGGFKPEGAPEIDILNERIIFSPSFGYKVVNLVELKAVTDEVYFKNYKPLYEKNLVRCRAGGAKAKGPVRCFISIGSKQYYKFSGETE